jgi:hypothetical protein
MPVTVPDQGRQVGLPAGCGGPVLRRGHVEAGGVVAGVVKGFGEVGGVLGGVGQERAGVVGDLPSGALVVVGDAAGGCFGGDPVGDLGQELGEAVGGVGEVADDGGGGLRLGEVALGGGVVEVTDGRRRGRLRRWSWCRRRGRGGCR